MYPALLLMYFISAAVILLASLALIVQVSLINTKRCSNRDVCQDAGRKGNKRKVERKTRKREVKENRDLPGMVGRELGGGGGEF